MNGEKNKTYEGFAYSRYKGTSDVTWRVSMKRIIDRERRNQEEK